MLLVAGVALLARSWLDSSPGNLTQMSGGALRKGAGGLGAPDLKAAPAGAVAGRYFTGFSSWHRSRSAMS
jgi:hypothetical protein